MTEVASLLRIRSRAGQGAYQAKEAGLRSHRAMPAAWMACRARTMKNRVANLSDSSQALSLRSSQSCRETGISLDRRPHAQLNKHDEILRSLQACAAAMGGKPESHLQAAQGPGGHHVGGHDVAMVLRMTAQLWGTVIVHLCGKVSLRSVRVQLRCHSSHVGAGIEHVVIG